MTDSRYGRLGQIEWWDQDTLKGARALVAGAGALGNELIKNLLMVGWGTVVVIDLDRVEHSNLSRSILFRQEDAGQWKTAAITARAAEVNPDCAVIGLPGDVRLLASAGLLARVDVVFGCLDNLAARVAVGQLSGRSGRLMIDGGLTTWEGSVRTFLPPSGPCYMCGLTEDDLHELTLRRSCLAYARRSDAAGGMATTPTIASVTAAVQLQQALKWIHKGRHSLDLAVGSELRFDLAYDRFWKSGIPQNPECVLHPEPVTPDGGLTPSWELSWASLLSLVREYVADQHVELYLPLQVVERSRCPACGHESQAARAHLGDLAVECEQCGNSAIPDLTNIVTGTETWLEASPRDMGFPPWTWVEASAKDKQHVFEFSGSTPELAAMERGHA